MCDYAVIGAMESFINVFHSYILVFTVGRALRVSLEIRCASSVPACLLARLVRRAERNVNAHACRVKWLKPTRSRATGCIHE